MSKLILTSEVSGLGSAGDVVEVKNGYARNYLIPQGFAVAWSRGGEKQVDQIKAARAARELATLEEAQDLKAKLEDGKLLTVDLPKLAAQAAASQARRAKPMGDARKLYDRLEKVVGAFCPGLAKAPLHIHRFGASHHHH